MMDRLLEQFIEEGRELVGSAAQGLLTLEKSPEDTALLDALFREVHTLKGSAGVLELAPMVEVVHVAEGLLEQAKDGEYRLDAQAVDVLLDAMDLLNSWLDTLEDAGSLPEEASSEGDAMATRLGALRDTAPAPDADTSAPAEDSVTKGEGIGWGLFDDAPGIGGEPPVDEAAAPATVAPDWLGTLPESTRMEVWQAAASDEPIWCLTFNPEEDCYFRGDDPLFMARQTPGLLALHVGLHPSDEPLAEMDVFRCRLWFGILSRQDAAALDTHFQYESDTVERAPLYAEALIQPQGAALGQPLDEAFLADLDRHWQGRNPEGIATAVAAQLELLNPDTREASLLRWLSSVARHAPDDALVFDTLLAVLGDPDQQLNEAGRIDWPEPAPAQTLPAQSAPEPPASTAPAVEVAPPSTGGTTPIDAADTRLETLVQDQIRLLAQCREDSLRAGAFAAARQVLTQAAAALGGTLPAALADARDADALEQALRNWQGGSGEIAGDSVPPPRAPATPARSPTQEPVSAPKSASPTATPVSEPAEPEDRAVREARSPVIRTFRVDQEQVEELGDLVGEMVVAKNALPFLAQRAEQVYGERQLGREIREQYNVINRITRALQDAMMQVQMLPVSHVFDRFPRLVRDLSRKLDKPIELDVQGAETEAEKHVIESLADPLIHLMRNAIDHGIESRSARIEAGKPETGHIRLQARQENEWVVIEVGDDGAGIDPEKTRRKAYEKGLVDERRLQEMSDQEAIELIFAPGFSTMEAASDLSGRGVGMDVVQTAIEKAGGRLDVDSRLGEGSRFRLWLPLSMSISQVMQIWIDGQRYGIPMDQVAETVRLPRGRLHRFKDRETVMLRDRVLPVCRARDQLGLPAEVEGESVALLVVRYRGEPVALLVDDFSEGVEVILKPMEGALEQLGVYQGTALLGDGSVLLVLNVGVLLSNVRLEEVTNDHSDQG